MSKKTHFEAMQMALSYASEHPETADLVAMFIKMSTHPKSSIKISVGAETEEDGFLSLLTSNLQNPRIVFSHWEYEPQMLIGNRFENVASINLAGCKILRSDKVKFDALNMERETFFIKTSDDMDYIIAGTFENCISDELRENE